jgi:multiple sugar transport system substrate-binding protein
MMKTWIRRGSQSALAILAGTFLLSGEVFAQSLRFWTTEEQPDRLAKQEQMAADFKSQTGVSVEVIPISEKDLGTRATLLLQLVIYQM